MTGLVIPVISVSPVGIVSIVGIGINEINLGLYVYRVWFISCLDRIELAISPPAMVDLPLAFYLFSSSSRSFSMPDFPTFE